MISEMSYDLVFDRGITEEHYISPGGYEVEISGKKIGFDFTDYYGTIDEKDHKLLHVRHCGLDTASFPDAAKIAEDMMNAVFTEFYVYTGEEDIEPEINPVSVKNIIFDFTEGTRIIADFELQHSANIALCH